MKSNALIRLALLLFTFSLLVTSCSTTKIRAVACPDLQKSHMPRKAAKKRQHARKLFATSPALKSGRLFATSPALKSGRLFATSPALKSGRLFATGNTTGPAVVFKSGKPVNVSQPVTAGKGTETTTTMENRTVSATVGSEWSNHLPVVTESGAAEAASAFTPAAGFPEITAVAGFPEITAVEGFLEIIEPAAETISETVIGESPATASSEQTQYQRDMPPPPQDLEALGLAGFIAGVIGLFVLGIPLGVTATVLGAVSLAKIKRNPGRYWGRGFALAALIIGIVAVVGAIVVLATMI